MDIKTSVICILFTALAASYGWGMRGALIGGEKGAMLPGAFIGLILAWFCGGYISMYEAAAAGLMGMTFGGIEPYGETIGFVLHRGREDYNPVRGYMGLAFKGALWFSICGGFIAISMSYAVYSTKELFIFCLLIPVIQKIGYLVFNKPYNKEKGIYPKIYFSKTRHEEWGSNLALLVAMIIMAVVKSDYFTLILISGGFIGGGIGWLVAMKLYVLAVFPLKNGKYILGKLYHNGVVDGWKIMEFALGAIGGAGLATAFCLGFDYVEEYKNRISLDGAEFCNESFSDWVPIICIACVIGILIVNFYQFICDKKGKKVNRFICDQIERPLYNVIPMFLVLIGATGAAKVMTVFILVFVCAIKCGFERFNNSKFVYLIQAVLFAGCAAVPALSFVSYGFFPLAVILSGIVPYMVAEFASAVFKNHSQGNTLRHLVTKTPFATVYPFFVLQSIAVLIISFKIFV